MAVLSSVWAILHLVSSSLLSDAARYYDEKKLCEFLDNNKEKAQCKQLIGGAVSKVCLVTTNAINELKRGVG